MIKAYFFAYSSLKKFIKAVNYKWNRPEIKHPKVTAEDAASRKNQGKLYFNGFIEFDILSAYIATWQELHNYLSISTSTSVIVERNSDDDYLRIDFNIRYAPLQYIFRLDHVILCDASWRCKFAKFAGRSFVTNKL
ncbi:protein disulfide isomerase-like 5-4 [Artemisia annua]|uniref:Protein disulfide isomerase-like 5-4 n=1 Tax=Artemisia annua TaxID=35608 RepID=A0A2U1MMH0_ARTAN|nr:protein disulfide isomerase-like 5-4 [Artemisia annua]